MKSILWSLIGGIVVHAALCAPVLAEVKVEEQELGPAGQWLGVAISPRGMHVAVLAMKGSRYVVLIDGVEEPKIDQILTLEGSSFHTDTNSRKDAQSIPVIFSDDGAHWAYYAKMGDEYLVMLDGKELARGKGRMLGLSSNGTLSFSPGGKHLFYVEMDTSEGYRIVMDGKPGPWSYTTMQVVVSPDGAHYAYIGTQKDRETKWAVVDGKQVKYFGDRLQFTATGGLLSIESGAGVESLLLNGKPMIRAAQIRSIWTAAVGAQVAAVVMPKPNGPTVLTINGKSIPGTEGIGSNGQIEGVYFSPDGKRHGILSKSIGSAFMIIDGKKGQEYQSIVTLPTPPTFTPDSSKMVYVAWSGSRSFVVIEEQESDGYKYNLSPVFGAGGKRIGFIAGSETVVIDGKALERRGPQGPLSASIQTSSLSFSPDGSHYAYLYDEAHPLLLHLDGVRQPDISVTQFDKYLSRTNNSRKPFQAEDLKYLFSSDGKHILLPGVLIADKERRGLFLDGKLVTQEKGNSGFGHAMFTPDSQHLLWVSHWRGDLLLFVDGKPTIPYEGYDSPLDTQAGNWAMSSDGVLTFVARIGDAIKRFRVTPSADTNLATMLAAAEAENAKAKADAEAAKPAKGRRDR